MTKKILADDYGVYFDDIMRDELMECRMCVKNEHINSFQGTVNLLSEFDEAKSDLKQIKAFRHLSQDGVGANIEYTLKDHIENYFTYLASCFNFDATCYFDVKTGVLSYELNTGDYFLLDDVENILKSRKFNIKHSDNDNSIVVFNRDDIEFVHIIVMDAHHVALNFAQGMCAFNSVHDIEFLNKITNAIHDVML